MWPSWDAGRKGDVQVARAGIKIALRRRYQPAAGFAGGLGRGVTFGSVNWWSIGVGVEVATRVMFLTRRTEPATAARPRTRSPGRAATRPRPCRRWPRRTRARSRGPGRSRGGRWRWCRSGRRARRSARAGPAGRPGRGRRSAAGCARRRRGARTETGWPSECRWAFSSRFANARSSWAASARTGGRSGSIATLKVSGGRSRSSIAARTTSSTEHQLGVRLGGVGLQAREVEQVVDQA